MEFCIMCMSLLFPLEISEIKFSIFSRGDLPIHGHMSGDLFAEGLLRTRVFLSMCVRECYC